MTVVLKPERAGAGGRLGWHQHHDERSRSFPVTAHPDFDPAKPLEARRWGRSRTPLNQGSLGSCTGNAACRMVAEAPGRSTRWQYTEALAVRLYKLATVVDDVGGHYPPDDTGSTTVGVLKAAQQLGLIKSYWWSFTDDDFLRTVDQLGPGVIGIDWYDGFDHPDADGTISISGAIRGGHELVVDALTPAGGGAWWLGGWQSWGRSWPAHGRWRMLDSTFRALRSAGAEAGIGVCT